MSENDKTFRGNASQFYIAGELCRRGHTREHSQRGILCSNREGTRFAHIQVKTFVPGSRTCSVGTKAMKPFGPSFFWVLGGIPQVGTDQSFEYYIIPAEVMAHHVTYAHDLWLKTPGKDGRVHQDNKVRTVHLPPYRSFSGWDISE